MTCDVTWPLESMSRRTSMRPSSGGSSLISNWLEPACARAAMATGRPAIETAAAGVVSAAVAAVWAVAVLVATMPKFGRPAVADFTAAAVLCAFVEVGSGAAVTAMPMRAVARFAAPAAVASAGDGAALDVGG